MNNDILCACQLLSCYEVVITYLWLAKNSQARCLAVPRTKIFHLKDQREGFFHVPQPCPVTLSDLANETSPDSW